MSGDATVADGVAIVGMSGRFPGASNVDAFWANMKGGVESVSRFSVEDLDIPAPDLKPGDPNSGFVCAKGVLDDIEMFDARFFGYLPREAELMDPQHRVFLELCWEAVEHAGYDAHRYPGAIGVYGGCYMDTYLMWNLCSDPAFLARFIDSIQVGSLQTELGNDKDYLATRVAFKLGLRGPAMTLQTACSTSLVAIATACQSVASYQCDMALAGGVTIVLPQKKGYFYKEGGMLSPDGHCRTFDVDAAGTVFSNGAAVLLLKRVEDAIADGDTIYGVIRGYATNNDGGAKVSYTAPSVEGQADVIALALAMADVDARTIGYVEAHGTATPMGDPIEVAGLTTAYRTHTPDKGYCAIGSVKANLGHLDIASGAIGLIKTALSLHHAVLPPQINFSKPNPKIDFAGSPFYVNTELKPWPANDWPRRAAVSSFGVGGTNAHVVVEQAPEAEAVGRERSHALLPLSARSKDVLQQQAERLAAHLEQHPDASLEDIGYTLQVGRREFEYRRTLVAGNIAEAVARLRGPVAPGTSGAVRTSQPRVVFMFPGQGAQYPGMARELYATEPVFRDIIDQCCEALDGAEDAEQNPRPYLLWDPEQSSLDSAQVAIELAQTRIAQPAIFAIEMALARLLQHWGIQPNALMGHSVGEFAGACVAGIFELRDAMRLVAARGRLMQAQPQGSMLVVRAPAEQLHGLLAGDVSIAAINAPGLAVVSGPDASIHSLAADLAQRDIATSLLATSHAFHSAMMAPARMPLVAAVAAVPRKPANLTIISTVSACSAGDQALSDPEYWGEQLMQPVRFADSVAVAAQDNDILIEVGPGQTLSTLARQSLAGQAPRTVVSCLGPVQSPGSDVESLLSAVGRLWSAGVAPDWDALQAGRRRRVALPTYPFERKAHWANPAPLQFGTSTMGTVNGTANDGTLSVPNFHGAGSRVDSGYGDEEHSAGVEQLIQQQLALISEQLKMMADAGVDTQPDASQTTSAQAKPQQARRGEDNG